MPLVEDPAVDLVSFTGSAATGRTIAEAAGRRLAKTVMELGGKNALVVCDDADLDRAVEWTLASAFSNAGQRCAAASRIVVMDAVYDDFRERLLHAVGRARDRSGRSSPRRAWSGSCARWRRRARAAPRCSPAARAWEIGAGTSRRRSSRACRPTRRSRARSSSAPSRRSTALGASRTRWSSRTTRPTG